MLPLQNSTLLQRSVTQLVHHLLSKRRQTSAQLVLLLVRLVLVLHRTVLHAYHQWPRNSGILERVSLPVQLQQHPLIESALIVLLLVTSAKDQQPLAQAVPVHISSTDPHVSLLVQMELSRRTLRLVTHVIPTVEHALMLLIVVLHAQRIFTSTIKNVRSVHQVIRAMTPVETVSKTPQTQIQH